MVGAGAKTIERTTLPQQHPESPQDLLYSHHMQGMVGDENYEEVHSAKNEGLMLLNDVQGQQLQPLVLKLHHSCASERHQNGVQLITLPSNCHR